MMFFQEFSFYVRAGAFAEDFITNLVICVFAIVTIFRCLSESGCKLSDCFPLCLNELSETVCSIRSVDFGSELCVQCIDHFPIIFHISRVRQGKENILNIGSREMEH